MQHSPLIHVYRFLKVLMMRDLKPYIEINYRAAKGPGATALLGAGEAARLAARLAGVRPDVFGYAGLLVSPAETAAVISEFKKSTFPAT